MRFASHRDVARAIERGVRRAGIPVAFSAGFSPHPRISHSGGAPTGSASEAEYLELAVTRHCEPDDVGRRLDAALPDGIDVIEVVVARGSPAGLRLEASAWEVTVPGVAPEAAASAVRVFLGSPSVTVERLTSKGTRTLDARAAVISLTCHARDADDPRRAGADLATQCAILRMVVRQMTPAVRPDDILTALRQQSALVPSSPPLATRLWQGPESELTAAQTGADTGMIAASPAVAGHPDLPERMTDKAMCLEAESAAPAPAVQARANEQLPRGTQSQLAGLRAREPYGRDCPDARDGATQQTVRTQ